MHMSWWLVSVFWYVVLSRSELLLIRFQPIRSFVRLQHAITLSGPIITLSTDMFEFGKNKIFCKYLLKYFWEMPRALIRAIHLSSANPGHYHCQENMVAQHEKTQQIQHWHHFKKTTLLKKAWSWLCLISPIKCYQSTYFGRLCQKLKTGPSKR